MAIYETTVESSFFASHAVQTRSGEIEPLHRHNWKILASFRVRQLDAYGFVIDFVQALDALKAIARELEGQDLNLVMPHQEAGVSAERVAQYLSERLHERLGLSVYSVCVSEATGCWAKYYADESPA